MLGKQSERIDSNSYSDNFMSRGTVVVPVNTEANKQAPYSGLDSDNTKEGMNHSDCYKQQEQ